MAYVDAKRVLACWLFMVPAAISLATPAGNQAPAHAEHPDSFSGRVDNPDADTSFYFRSQAHGPSSIEHGLAGLESYVCNDVKGDASKTLVFTWASAGFTTWKAGPVRPGQCLVLSKGRVETRRDEDARIAYTTHTDLDAPAGAYGPQRVGLAKAIDSVTTRLQLGEQSGSFGGLFLPLTGGTFVEISAMVDFKAGRTRNLVKTGPDFSLGILALPPALSNVQFGNLVSGQAGGQVLTVQAALNRLKLSESDVASVGAWLGRAHSSHVLFIDKSGGSFEVAWPGFGKPGTVQQLPLVLFKYENQENHPVAGIEFLTFYTGD